MHNDRAHPKERTRPPGAGRDIQLRPHRARHGDWHRSTDSGNNHRPYIVVSSLVGILFGTVPPSSTP